MMKNQKQTHTQKYIEKDKVAPSSRGYLLDASRVC